MCSFTVYKALANTAKVYDIHLIVSMSLSELPGRVSRHGPEEFAEQRLVKDFLNLDLVLLAPGYRYPWVVIVSLACSRSYLLVFRSFLKRL